MLEGVKESTRQREAYFLDYAAKARAVCRAPLVVTGGFRSTAGMESALQSGHLDMVGLAKPFALMPDLPAQIFAGRYQILHTRPVRLGIAKIDRIIGSTLEMNWYMYQMERLSRGLPPKADYGAWRLLLRMLRLNGGNAFRKERA